MTLTSIRCRWRDANQARARLFLPLGGDNVLPWTGGAGGAWARRRLKRPKANVTQNTEVKRPKSTAFRMVSICSSVG